MMTLADTGSMTEAARRLNISQPALSRWLSGLEGQLGTTLYVRANKRLLLTESGRIYLEGCRECIDAATAMREEIRALSEQPQAVITLGGSPIRGAQAFARVYRRFRAAYPDIQLQFVVGHNVQLTRELLDGEITMALLGSIRTNMSELEYLKFMEEELLMMIPHGHPLYYDSSRLSPGQPWPTIDLHDLGDTPILVNEPSTSYYDLVISLYRDAGLEGNIILRSGVIPLLYEMVLNGIGAALIPSSYYKQGDPICVYSLSPRLVVYQGIGLRRDHHLTPAEEFLIHQVMNSWGMPAYMHQYADYYLEQRKERMTSEERNP